MPDTYPVGFKAAAEREPFLPATDFDWDFDEWFTAIITDVADHRSSSWAGPVASLYWELAPIEAAYPDTASLQVEIRLGDTPNRGPLPLSRATAEEHTAAAGVFNRTVSQLLDTAKELPVFDDRTTRQVKVRSNDEDGTVAYLSVEFDEPASLSDTDRDVINSQLSAFSRRHLFGFVESLLRAGVFVRRSQVRGLFESSGVGELTVDLLR